MPKKVSKALVPMAKAPKKIVVKTEDQPKPPLKPISGKEFIQMLKKYPCLYDRSHPEFGKPHPSLHAWNNFAEQTGRRVKSLKDRLTKISKAAQNGAAESVELVRLLNHNRLLLARSSSKKRHSRESKPRSILKTNALVPMSLATASKKVRFVNEEDTNNNIDDDESDENFFDFIKTKLSKLSIAQRSELKAFVKAKIPEYFLSLGQ